MTSFLKLSPKLYPLFTAGRNISDEAIRKAFEEYTSILLDAFSNEDLADEISTVITNNSLLGISYAVAQGTWTRASGNGSYVSCRAASDPVGTLTSDATTFNVYLPRSSQDKDPNVYAGDILQYVEVSSVKYAIGESYLDDTIGVIKGIYHTNIPNGWDVCDGGGSTPNFTARFLRANTSAGGTGGSNTHSHTFTGTGGTTGTTSLSITGSTGTQALTVAASSGTTGSNTTGITIADHPDHTHNLSLICQAQEAVGPWCGNATTLQTGGVLVGGAAAALSHPVTDPGHTHSIGSHTHTISPDPHSHTLSASVTPDPHSHSFTPAGTVNDGSNVPVYTDVIWIIRIGPSGEIS